MRVEGLGFGIEGFGLSVFGSRKQSVRVALSLLLLLCGLR